MTMMPYSYRSDPRVPPFPDDRPIFIFDAQCVLLIDGVALIKAERSIRLAVGLGLPWSLAIILRVLPRRLADVLYEWVARNRFRMFGRRETCYLPRTVDRERFIA
jgi:predicted DCC family thiol-disulfide oxidoreductase YuxK